MHQLKIPRSWRRALVDVIPKPNKPFGDPKSYHPMLYLYCMSPSRSSRDSSSLVSNQSINLLIPREQAAFRHGKSTVDQVTLLTQDIEDSVLGKKARVVFVDLTADYDIVWHRGPTCMLLRLLPDKHMVHIITELIANRSFTLTTGSNKRSKLRRLVNGVPQGSVRIPLLFNIYTSDLPITVSRKYAYADDLAIMHDDRDWQVVEGVLSKDMGDYR